MVSMLRVTVSRVILLVGIMSMLIMCNSSTMSPIIMMNPMISIIFFIFFFTELICLIPCCLDEYFECRVQMDNKNEEYKTQYSKYNKEYDLYADNRKECHNARYNEWKYKKYDCDNNRTKIEEDHRIIQLYRNTNMSHSHSCR